MKLINLGSGKFQSDNCKKEKKKSPVLFIFQYDSSWETVQSPTRAIYPHALQCPMDSIKFIFAIRGKVDPCKAQELLPAGSPCRFCSCGEAWAGMLLIVLNLRAELINKHTLTEKPFALLHIWGLFVSLFMVVFISALSCQFSSLPRLPWY